MAERPEILPSDAGASPPHVLSTKLHVPHVPATFVERERLVARLEPAPTRRVTLVCAPAGFGKSVLVAGWCRRSDRATAWLSLDGGDNDPVRFWRHTAAALDRALDAPQPLVTTVVESAARDTADSVAERVATGIVNVLDGATEDVVLVLDDYHAIEDRRVHSSVGFLLDHAPPALHVVLVSRSDPPFPLARWRARGELVELREAELRFLADEAATLLRRASGTALPTGAAATLTTRTEGWAAGLQLAGLSLRTHPDAAAFVEEFSGSHRFVLDYLTDEVLEGQPASVRDFLVRTSLLERLSGPLCDAVTGRTDSQAVLEAIEQANLFLVPLDDVRGWWRYHHLFADLLAVQLGQLPPDDRRALHRRAARWLEDHGLADRAIGHAVRAGEAEWAARIVERHADELLLRREGATLQRWLGELPDEAMASRRLLLARARVALYAGRVTTAEELLAAAREPRDGPGRTPFEPSVDRAASPLADLSATQALLEAFVAHLRGRSADAVSLAAAVLDDVDDERSATALIARWHMATALWLDGPAGEAEPAIRANIERWRSVGEYDRAAWSAHYLGHVQQARGRLDAALDTYERVLTRDARRTGPDAATAAVAHVGMAEVAYQRNDLAAARGHAEEGVDRGRSFVYTQTLALGLSTLARVCHAEGDPTGARELIAEAVELGPDREVVELLNPVPVHRAQLLLADGDTGAVAAWADAAGLRPDDEAAHPREPAYLMLARLLVAQRRPQVAVRLLDRLRASAAADGRRGSLIEIRAVRALAAGAAGDEDGARRTLATAVADAAPQEHVRVFVDEGPPMAALVAELAASPRSIDDEVLDADLVGHLGRLTRAFEADGAGAPGADDAGPLAVPLTDREHEVLALVARGRTNKEIAAELFVSLNTVKKHVTHIFDKLGVANRTAAADRARELGLLP